MPATTAKHRLQWVYNALSLNALLAFLFAAVLFVMAFNTEQGRMTLLGACAGCVLAGISIVANAAVVWTLIEIEYKVDGLKKP